MENFIRHSTAPILNDDWNCYVYYESWPIGKSNYFVDDFGKEAYIRKGNYFYGYSYSEKSHHLDSANVVWPTSDGEYEDE